jgi:hypothetical protein
MGISNHPFLLFPDEEAAAGEGIYSGRQKSELHFW